MTGFGRGESSNATHSVSVELSAVNRKQSEVSMNLPRSLSEYEAPLRKLILSQISRGRVNCQISITHLSGDAEEIDIVKVQRLEAQFQALSATLDRPLLPSVNDFLQIPGIFVTTEIDPEEIIPTIKEAIHRALTGLLEMRRREGADLLTDCQQRLATLEQLLGDISSQSPLILDHYRASLITKLQEANLGLENLHEDERIIKEVALFADRSDISEEITRFRSHLDKFYEYLRKDEPIGRSLDFLCQELNRELNTIGSKANNASLAHLVVTGKTEVEKIREQIQNAE